MPHYAVEGPSGSEEAGHSPLIRSNSTDPHSSNPATSRQQDPVAPPQSGNNQPNTHDVRPVDRREFQRLQASVDRMMTLMETMSMSQHNASSNAVPAHPQPPPAQQTQSDPHHRPLFFPPHQQTQSFSSHRPFPQSFHHAPHLFPPNPQQQSNNTPQFRSHPAAQLPPTAHVPPTAQARRPAASAPQQAYEHQLVAEPPKLEDIWFTGDSVHLLHFLRLVRNFLRINLHFQSDSRRIAWIAQHFGHPPSHHSAIPAPSINYRKLSAAGGVRHI
ncbi:hypothetical protein PtB15_3B344 [Puccinia triticina]|nr:hypothetical protein PtB15_3B344 [Puccinia triticina]